MAFEFFSELIDRFSTLKYEIIEAQTFNKEHFGFLPIYYKAMETDTTRVKAFVKAFQYYDFTDKIVCEAGIGTLALTKHFLPFVKKAYLIENNPDLKDFIEEEISKNGWQDKVEVIYGNAMEIVLPEPVDYIVGELMSIYCGNEYQVQIFKHLRQFLKPEGKLLPEFITNIIQLAYADFDLKHKHYPINFTRHLPEQLSLQQVINVIDLYQIENEIVDKTIEITPILTGTINCVYLHSSIQIAKGCNFTGTDSLMPPTVCRLEKTVQVKQNQTVKLHIQFKYGTSLDDAKFWIEEEV